MNVIHESVLDPIQTVRCDALFNANDKSDQPVILQNTKDFILSLLDKFKAESGLKFNYDQVFIIGSSLGYQYKDTSDIDVEARIDIPREKFKGKFHTIPKEIMIPGTSHPVNVFIIFADDPEYDFDNAENAYDLLSDSWIKQGKLANSDPIPYDHVAGMSEFIMDGMCLELSRAERDLYELNKYMNIDTTRTALTEKERKDAISRKITELIIDKDALRLAHSLVFRFEDEGFKGNAFQVSIKYEAQDKHYVMNNLVYKYIDQFGYYEKITDMVKQIDSAIKAAKKDITTTKTQSPETMNQAEAQDEIMSDIQNYTDTRNGVAAPKETAAEVAPPEEEVNNQQYSIDDIIQGYADGAVTDQDIQDSLDNGEISEEEYNQIIKKIKKLNKEASKEPKEKKSSKKESVQEEVPEENQEEGLNIEDIVQAYLDGAVTEEDIEESLQNGEITEDEYDQIVAAIQSQGAPEDGQGDDNIVDDAVQAYIDGAITEEDIEASLQSGEIDKATYTAIINKIADVSNQEISEAFTNKELKEILLENGLEPSKKNVTLLKCHNYYIVDNPDVLFEDLASRTEKKINKMIVRKAGAMSDEKASLLGWLFAGPLGAFLAYDLNHAKKEEKDEKVRNLYNIIDNDSKCYNIIENIKSEVHSDEPDKAKLRQLKQQLSVEVNRCVRESKKNPYESKPSIKLED